MQDVMTRLIDVPMARMFVLAGIIFLLVAVLGRIEGKIEPGNIGRVGATIVGILLIAGGLAMYFIEGDSMRDRMRGAGVPVVVAPPGAPARPAGGAIKVVAATWGPSCNAKPGNATAALAQACDGRALCDYRLDPEGIEDPDPKCEKDLKAEWKCGAGATVYAVSLPASGAREAMRLACAGG